MGEFPPTLTREQSLRTTCWFHLERMFRPFKAAMRRVQLCSIIPNAHHIAPVNESHSESWTRKKKKATTSIWRRIEPNMHWLSSQSLGLSLMRFLLCSLKASYPKRNCRGRGDVFAEVSSLLDRFPTRVSNQKETRKLAGLVTETCGHLICPRVLYAG